MELPGITHWIPEQAPDQLAAAILDRIASPERIGRRTFVRGRNQRDGAPDDGSRCRRGGGVPVGGAGVAGDGDAALVDGGVVPLAEQRAVLAAVGPPWAQWMTWWTSHQAAGIGAAGEHAVPVALLEAAADGGGGGSAAPGRRPAAARPGRSGPRTTPASQASRRAVSAVIGPAKASSPPATPGAPRSAHSANQSMVARTWAAAPRTVGSSPRRQRPAGELDQRVAHAARPWVRRSPAGRSPFISASSAACTVSPPTGSRCPDR